MQNLTKKLALVTQGKDLKTTSSEPCESHSRPQNDLQQRVTTTAALLQTSLLPVLTVYHTAFAAQFCSTVEQIEAVMAQFAERMIVEGVTRKGLLAGIEALKVRAGHEKFPPNPQEFALMCKQASGHSNGLPSLQDVLVEIIQRRGVERFNADWQFSHELIRLINQRKGGMIYEQTGMQFEQTIKAEYDHWVKRLEAGEQLPQPLQAISQKPAEPEHLKGITPQSALAKRVEAMRKDANARKLANQIKPDNGEAKPC